MKRVKKPVFFIVAVLILALAFTSVCGVYTQNGDTKNTWIKGVGDIRWGIDIRGGVDVTFTPPEGVDATDSQMDAAEAVITTRLVSLNITDNEDYTDRLTEIFRMNDINSVTVTRMQVPCCGGMENTVKKALNNAGKHLPLRVVTISSKGEILKDENY